MEKNDKFIAQKIHTEYSEKKSSDVDTLCELDKKVKLPANIFAYVFGVVGALILGAGMCFAMKVIGNIMAVGIVVGLVGIGYGIFKNYQKTIGNLEKFSQKYQDCEIKSRIEKGERKSRGVEEENQKDVDGLCRCSSLSCIGCVCSLGWLIS